MHLKPTERVAEADDGHVPEADDRYADDELLAEQALPFEPEGRRGAIRHGRDAGDAIEAELRELFAELEERCTVDDLELTSDW